MSLKMKSRKLVANLAVVAAAMSVFSSISIHEAGAQEVFIGQQAQTTEGVANPNQGEGEDRPLGNPETEVSLEEYWSSTRMSQATPIESTLDIPGEVDKALAGNGMMSVSPEVPDREQPASAPVVTSSSSSVAKNTYSRIGNSGAANGKVFFSKNENGVYKDYVCSASAVNSNNKSTVITAGHCVHGGKGGEFHKNWVFVPEYTVGIAPHGKFTSNYMTTTSDWASYGDSYRGFAADFGFVTVNSLNGKRLNEVVGGHGLRSGNAGSFNADIIGYPGNRFFGASMFRCTTPVKSEKRSSFDFYMSYGCNFGGGASGGAWLEDFDGKLGYIRSVSSFGPKDSTAYLGSPLITENIWKMFDSTANRPVR